MNMLTLDQMLPKRWNLLLRHYLPFFKKPDTFYFECREFVNDLKKKGNYTKFPLDKLPELLVILENYSKNNANLVEFSKKIIGTLEKRQLQAINPNLLKQSLSKYGIENNDQTPILNTLFNQLPGLVRTSEDENENFISIEKTKEFDSDTAFNDFQIILKNKCIETIEAFLRAIPSTQWSIFIDKLINYFYELLKIKGTSLTEKLNEKNSSFQVLNCILDNYKISNEHYPINIMQFLAITSLLNFPIDIEKISKISMELKFKENFSIELQEFLAENRIKALKNLIQLDFIEKIPKISVRNGGIRRKFHQFNIDDYPNKDTTPVKALESIIQNLPKSIIESDKEKLNFIQKLFQFIYGLLDSSLVREIKTKRFLAAERDRKKHETLAEERRELTKRIGRGEQTSVSNQRMKEVFGEDALKMEKKWEKKVTFFDANNAVERQIALQKAATLKAVYSR